MQIASRLNKVRQKLAEQELDAILVSQPENRYYLSGFSGSAGYLLITAQSQVLATDSRYIEQVKIQAPDYEIFNLAGQTSQWFPKLLEGHNIKKLGFEPQAVSFAQYRLFTGAIEQAKMPVRMQPADDFVETFRAVKDADELEQISQAAAIGDSAIEHITGVIRPGMTEKAIAWEIEKFMREHGSQVMPFDVIVASGTNSALPHAQPSDRPIREGEPIVMDIGARVGFYASDLTRTICPGKPDEQFKKIYDIVLGAQLTAIAIMKEGMTGDEAHRLALNVIQEAGYAPNFGHGLGHGVGLAVHEAPRLGLESKDILQAGMVITIEPGIYIPGWGGVRIEDLAIIENGRVKLLSKTIK